MCSCMSPLSMRSSASTSGPGCMISTRAPQVLDRCGRRPDDQGPPGVSETAAHHKGVFYDGGSQCRFHTESRPPSSRCFTGHTSAGTSATVCVDAMGHSRRLRADLLETGSLFVVREMRNKKCIFVNSISDSVPNAGTPPAQRQHPG